MGGGGAGRERDHAAFYVTCSFVLRGLADYFCVYLSQECACSITLSALAASIRCTMVEVVVVAFSSLVRIWGEGWAIHYPPALFICLFVCLVGCCFFCCCFFFFVGD